MSSSIRQLEKLLSQLCFSKLIKTNRNRYTQKIKLLNLLLTVISWVSIVNNIAPLGPFRKQYEPTCTIIKLSHRLLNKIFIY
jgi:hypothetical protein